VPVWHAAVKEWVAEERLVLIGLTQEQHPERCRLFAQWKGLDFPILWDPFNLTGSKVVPNFIAIDEHGIVWSTKAELDSFESDFLAVDFPAPREAERPSFVDGACGCTQDHHFVSPMSSLLQGRDVDDSVEAVKDRALADPGNARLAFRAGVALRMRYDSEHARPTDFQGAIDFWTRALALDPNQYIWRRRIQQYGPRMDKPYPFYSWVETARAEILARGETPIALQADLTAAELAAPRRDAESANTAPSEPDPEGLIQHDERGLVAIESAAAFDTSRDHAGVAFHLALRPSADLDAHWNHETGPAVQVWVDGEPANLMASQARDDTATSSETLRFDFDRTLAADAAELRVSGYALYYVCEGAAGKCLYLRQDFELVAKRP
jgi:hypothetical protein